MIGVGVVVYVGLWAITSLYAGPAIVTHECPQSITVSVAITD